jgi:hypothetical protein
MVYVLLLFLFKMKFFFHNSNIFGSCIIHILYTGCAKIKKKFLRQKVKVAINWSRKWESSNFALLCRSNLAKTAGVFNLDTKGKCVTSVILRRFMVWCPFFERRPDGFWDLSGRICGNESIIEIRTAVFWSITQRLVAIAYRRFGTTCRPHLQNDLETSKINSAGPWRWNR